MKNLFAGLAIMVMLAGCSNLPAVQKAETKLENFTEADAATAIAQAKANNRPEAAACYQAISDGLKAATKPATDCGLLCNNEILAALNAGYRKAQAACSGSGVVLP